METKPPHYVIILAGGTGKRMNSTIPKQFLEIHNKPIIFHTIERFLEADSSIHFVIALHPDFTKYWEKLISSHNFNIKHTVVTGGIERFYSVKNALEIVPNNSIVGIHDSVRPMVSTQTVLNCFETAISHNSAIPVVDSVNSLRYVSLVKNESIDRNNIKQVQTPQYFNSKLIKESYSNKYSRKFTDDATVYEANNSTITTIEGNPENIKITSPIDLIIANELLKTK